MTSEAVRQNGPSLEERWLPPMWHFRVLVVQRLYRDLFPSPSFAEAKVKEIDASLLKLVQEYDVTKIASSELRTRMREAPISELEGLIRERDSVFTRRWEISDERRALDRQRARFARIAMRNSRG